MSLIRCCWLVNWNFKIVRNKTTIYPDKVSEEVLYFQAPGEFPLRLIFEPAFEKSAAGIDIVGPW